MRSRFGRKAADRAEYRALVGAASNSRLPEKQLLRERLVTFRSYFQRPKTARAEKGFNRRIARDAKRRREAGEAVVKDLANGQEPWTTNRAMRRAVGERHYSYGLGRMDVPKDRR